MKKLFILAAIISVAVFHSTAQMPMDGDLEYRVTKGTETLDTDTLPKLVVSHSGDDNYWSGEGYRMITWIHGLNGDASALSKPASATINGTTNFPPRKVYNAFVDYKLFQMSFKDASAAVIPQVESGISPLLSSEYEWTDGFIISHSQGGLVSRYMDYYFSLPENQHARSFGGIITLATSNQGAQIINNKLIVSKLLHDLANIMTQGPIADEVMSFGMLGLLFYSTIEELRARLLNIAVYEEDATGITAGFGKHLINANYPGITEQYAVGASMIQDTLNTYVPNGTHIVPFYSVRDILTVKEDVDVTFDPNIQGVSPQAFSIDLPVPISWATIQYFIHSPSQMLTYFDAEKNEHLLALEAHKTRARFETRRAYYDVLTQYYNYLKAKSMGTLRFGSAIAFHNLYMTSKGVRNAYARGVRHFDNFDQYYRIAIGAYYSEIEQMPTGTFKCRCIVEYPYNSEPSVFFLESLPPDTYCEDMPNSSELPYYIPVLNTNNLTINCNNVFEYDAQFVWRNKESDGVVLAESAMDIPQATFEAQRINGSTHMALRNDKNLMYRLLEIYSGDVGEYFFTPIK